MAYDAFISYSTQDKLTADAVCGILESQGIRCWIAPRDIALGADWTESLVDAIEQCPVLVLVFSKHANESHQIKREVNLAIDNGRTVIPVRVEDVMPSKSLKFSININHWLDAFPPPLENHLRTLAASIRTHLKAAPEKGEVLGGALAPAASAEIFVPETVTHEPDLAVTPPPQRAPEPPPVAATPVAKPPPTPIISYPPLPPVEPTPPPVPAFPAAKAPAASPPPAFTLPPAKTFTPPPIKKEPLPASTVPVEKKAFLLVPLLSTVGWALLFVFIVAFIDAYSVGEGEKVHKLNDAETESVGGWFTIYLFLTLLVTAGLSYFGILPGTKRR
jgi:hypothetical protein